MKKIIKLVPIALIVPFFQGLNTNESQRVFAAKSIYTESELPTTINLNDYTSTEIRSYYSGLNSLSASELKGNNLLKNLKPILSNNQKYYSYDENKDNKIWKIYEISDRDWIKSPATAITYGTYNSITNIISNYDYGSSASSKNNNPYIHSLYVDRTIDNPKTAWDVHNVRSDSKCIEREHIWPKSHGFDAEQVSGARGDPMHLWPADGGANGLHGNYFYGNVDLTKEYKSSKTSYSWTGNNYKGFSRSITGSTAQVFEPQDCDKGDIARACFYMVARYNNIAGNDNHIDSANPNLFLSNDVSKSEETGTSTATVPFSLGVLKDLLEWNKLDPVDDYEIHRNNLLHRNFTNNRNPFIDFPEWADVIWGEDSSLVANPATDALNDSDPRTPNTISYFTVSDINYGETISPSATAIVGDVSFDYSENETGPFVPEKPISAGTYFVRATSQGNDEYKPQKQVKKFRVAGDPNTISQFVVDNVKEGKEVNPTATCLKGEVKFSYSTDKKGPFVSEKPTEPGTYYCKATSPNDGKYEGQSETKEFKVLKKTFMDSITDENGLVFGVMEQKVFYVVVVIGAVAVVSVVFLIYLKGKKKTKKKTTKIIKSVAKEAGINIPSAPKTTSSKSTKKPSSSTSKSTAAKKSSSTKSSGTRTTKK